MRTATPLPTKKSSARKRAADAGELTYVGVKCPLCGHRDRTVADQRCVYCLNEGQTYYARHREVQLAAMKAAQKKRWTEDLPKALWTAAKYRAEKYGREFNIEISDIVVPEICPVFGTPMVRASLDRKDNTLGYVKGNVSVISYKANALKKNGSIEDFERILAYMKGQPHPKTP